MRLPDFLQEVEPGEIRLTGHRIGLYHVVDLSAGEPPAVVFTAGSWAEAESYIADLGGG